MGADQRNHLFAPGLSPGWRTTLIRGGQGAISCTLGTFYDRGVRRLCGRRFEDCEGNGLETVREMHRRLRGRRLGDCEGDGSETVRETARRL